MAPKKRKSSKQSEIDPSSPIAKKKSYRNYVLPLSELPEELLAAIFICCDLPTRCRLRRVCRLWKFIFTLPETNQLIQVHHPLVPSRIRWFSKYLMNLLVRIGFLGLHVTTLIYDGLYTHHHGRDLVEICSAEVLLQVGVVCPNIRHLVVRRVEIDAAHDHSQLNKENLNYLSAALCPLPLQTYLKEVTSLTVTGWKLLLLASHSAVPGVRTVYITKETLFVPSQGQEVEIIDWNRYLTSHERSTQNCSNTEASTTSV